MSTNKVRAFFRALFGGILTATAVFSGYCGVCGLMMANVVSSDPVQAVIVKIGLIILAVFVGLAALLQAVIGVMCIKSGVRDYKNQIKKEFEDSNDSEEEDENQDQLDG